MGEQTPVRRLQADTDSISIVSSFPEPPTRAPKHLSGLPEEGPEKASRANIPSVQPEPPSRPRGINKLFRFLRSVHPEPEAEKPLPDLGDAVAQDEGPEYRRFVDDDSNSRRSSASTRRSSYEVGEETRLGQVPKSRYKRSSSSGIRSGPSVSYSVSNEILSSVNGIINGAVAFSLIQPIGSARPRPPLSSAAAASARASFRSFPDGPRSSLTRLRGNVLSARAGDPQDPDNLTPRLPSDALRSASNGYPAGQLPPVQEPSRRKPSLTRCPKELVVCHPIGSPSSGSQTPSTAPTSRTGSRLNLYSTSPQSGDSHEADTRCGWLCFRPDWLQRARSSRWLLFWLCWAAAIQGMVVNGFVNVCITTIEKRYDLRSKDTGIVAGAYDMASVLCSIPVAYFGSRHGASKSRWIAAGMLIMGLGSFVFALPHFVTPSYVANVGPSSGAGSLSTIKCSHEPQIGVSCDSSGEVWLSNFRYVFGLGQVLHGVGATPLYTLGVTYLDESVPVRMSSVYLAVYYAMAVVGPAVGYVMGGQFLSLYINAPQEDPILLGLDSSSDRWLGGWWMGFLLSGCASILVAAPLFGFPAVITDLKEGNLETHRPSKNSAAMATPAPAPAGGMNAFQELNDFPSATRSLMSNVTFVALSLAGATEGILLSGFATFIPKFIESQFSVAASFSALVVGFIAVPAGGGGTLLGGWLIKKYEMSCSSILKLLFTGSLFCLFSCFSLLIYCPNQEFAGVDVNYIKDLESPLPNLTSACNMNCGCRDVSYNPVCGANNVVYYSPCHAGCTERHQFGLKEVYTNCSCISSLAKHSGPHASSSLELPHDMPPELLPRGLVLRDTCPTSCGMMPYFMFLFLVMMLFTFTISLPALSGTLRSVAEEQRSLALGVQWIIVRLLGTIPGPILFGMVIDYTCRLWQESCDSRGSCLSYDNFYMSRYMLGISFTAKAISSTLFLVSWWFYRPPKEASSTTPLDNIHPISSSTPPTPQPRAAADTPSHLAYDNPAVEIT